MKYTITIQWSEEDQCFVVFLPEFTDVLQPCTHGETYEEALKNAQEVLELLIETATEEGKPLPEPKKFAPPKIRRISKRRALQLASLSNYKDFS